MKDYIQDLTKYVVSTGFFDKIKITAGNKDITVEAIEKERDIILKGKFNKPLDGLEGEFGLANLSLLQTITSDPESSNGDSAILKLASPSLSAQQIVSDIVHSTHGHDSTSLGFSSPFIAIRRDFHASHTASRRNRASIRTRLGISHPGWHPSRRLAS